MRRIISVLLAITMLFSCAMVAMAEDAAATPVVGAEEIDFLAKLGIMDADADPEATITRAEMAKIVMMCLGQGADLAPTNTPFTDVNIANEYSGYIQLANSAGIMVGGGDGKFDPNGNVTYNQVVKLLTHAIGHEAFAQASGGYPGGYLMSASSNGMLVGTTPAGEQAVSHGVAAILIKNALDIDVYERIAYGDVYEYVAKDGVTTLTKFFDIYEYQGVITANHFASISGTANIKEDEIIFDGATVLKTGDSGVEDYLGYLVNIYVQIDKDAKHNTVVAAYPIENSVTVVNGANVMADTTESLLVYLDETGTERIEVEIDSNADMIYNGSSKFWSAADLKGNFGDITAIDNDGDGDIDVLIVYNYRNVVVSSTKTLENKVFTKDETDPAWKTITIDPDSRSVRTTFVNVDGEDVLVEELEEWNVISIAISENGDVMKAILCDETVEGEIVAFDGEKITIGEDTYEYDATKVAAPTAASFGREAVFYLDFAGRIAAIDYEGAINNLNYGYIRSAAVSGTGFNRKAEIEMLVEEGIKEFDLAKDVKFNGVKMTGEAAVVQPELVDGGVVTKQLIMYSLDDEGKINKIATAVDDTANNLSEAVKADTFTIDDTLTGDGAYYYGSSSMRYFARKYLVRETTKVFVVQNPSEATDREELYKVMSPASVTSDYWGKAIIYDVNDDHIAGAVVIYYVDGMFSRSTGDHTAGIVTAITQAMDEDGEPINRYHLYNQSGVTMTLDLPDDQKTITHTVASNIVDDPNTTDDDNFFDEDGKLKAEISISDIRIGDVIQYSTNLISGKIEQIRFVARLGNFEMRQNDIGDSKGYAGTGVNSGYYFTGFGTVADVFRDGIEFASYDIRPTGTTPISMLILVSSSAKVVRYDKSEKTLTVISRDELVEDDVIYVYRSNFIVNIVE